MKPQQISTNNRFNTHWIQGDGFVVVAYLVHESVIQLSNGATYTHRFESPYTTRNLIDRQATGLDVPEWWYPAWAGEYRELNRVA